MKKFATKMQHGTQLNKTDVLGRKIVRVYQKAGKKVGRFQNRLIFIHLDNDIIFSLSELRDPEEDVPLKIQRCMPDNTWVPVISIDKDPNLDSPIKAIVSAPHFADSTAILLDNDFVLTIGIGEFDMGCSFYLPSEQFRVYSILTIAGN